MGAGESGLETDLEEGVLMLHMRGRNKIGIARRRMWIAICLAVIFWIAAVAGWYRPTDNLPSNSVVVSISKYHVISQCEQEASEIMCNN